MGSSSPNPSTGRAWTLVTNHGAVLLHVAEHPDARIRDIAEEVGITQRATLSILADLVNDGYVDRKRVGRRNQYHVDASKPLRHQAVASRGRVTDLLVIVRHEPDDSSGQMRWTVTIESGDGIRDPGDIEAVAAALRSDGLAFAVRVTTEGSLVRATFQVDAESIDTAAAIGVRALHRALHAGGLRLTIRRIELTPA